MKPEEQKAKFIRAYVLARAHARPGMGVAIENMVAHGARLWELMQKECPPQKPDPIFERALFLLGRGTCLGDLGTTGPIQQDYMEKWLEDVTAFLEDCKRSL